MTKDRSESCGAQILFPVVGIGTSAGGLEALRKLFLATPPDSGAAYVIVQHLDPSHDSMMVELLTKYTDMRVVQVENNMPVAPNVIHIIPPNCALIIDEGILKLAKPVKEHGARMAIDLFLESLAEDRQKAAIGVILSGTGTDGTHGVRAVKAHGGLVVIQDPAFAQYDGMPRSAIATGEADYVLKAGEIPDVIHQYAEVLANPELKLREKSDKDYVAGITALLQARQGYDFGCYKRGTLERRIIRRMKLQHIERLSDYHALLRHDNQEVRALIGDLLNSVTCFFRDRAAWDFLQQVLPERLQRHHDGDRMRVWVPGCATGEEAYGLAMLLAEAVEELDLPVAPLVFATDIAGDALDSARVGHYPASIAENVSPQRLERFFERDGKGYIVKPVLREMTVFAPHDLISDPPFTNLDLISCRNLLIYLKPAYQRRILSWFHFALADAGILVLGGSENLGNSVDLFQPLSSKWRVYRRLDSGRPRNLDLLLGAPGKARRRSSVPLPHRREQKFGQLTRNLLLKNFAPAAVLVDENLHILYFQGPVGDYLGPTTGEPSADLLALVDEPLRLKLRTALQQAGRQRRPVQLSGARVRRGKQWQAVRVAVHPVQQSGDPAAGMTLITFEDQAPRPEGEISRATSGDAGNGRTRQLDEELASTRQELRETLEQMETSSEELKASNEEILSMNEELQCSNEELETSKEELQSLNEALITLNNQLEEKVHQLARSTDDLQNLLTSTNIATIFVDRSLRIQRYTPAATRLLTLLATDSGRLLTDVAWRFSDARLPAEAKQILLGQGPFEREVQTDDGCWYLRTLTPYRTAAGMIEGVVITFVDITERRAAAMRLRESERFLTRITDAMPGMISYVDASKHYRFNNAAYEAWFGRKPSELTGLLVRDVHEPAFYAQAETYIDAALRGESVSFEIEMSDMARRPRAVHVVYIPDVDGDTDRVNGFYALITDVTERQEHEREIVSLNVRLRQQVEEQEALFAAAPVGLFVAHDPQCGNMTMNPAGAQLLRLEESTNPSLSGPGARELPFRIYRDGRPLEARELPIQRSAAEGQRIDNEEIEVRFQDGKIKHLSVYAEPLYEDGDVRGCIGVLIDSTDYRIAIAALAEADRRKDQFLALLAHELRNPLTPLVAAADLLERDGATPQVIERLRHALVNQTRHLWRLVDDLLDVSRAVHDRMELQLEPLDLRRALRDAVATVEAESRRCGHQLHVDLPDEDLPISGDPTRLTQIFSNLLKNAVNYTPPPGHITLSAHRDGDWLLVRIEDTGSGLTADDLDRIFEPLARGRRQSEHNQGLGLGLALAKRIVEMHGGTIQAFSEGLNRGSRFTVTLPASPAVAATSAATHAARPGSTEPPGTLRILIVDDQKDVADAVTLLLQMLGHTTHSVTHPDDVVPAIRRFKPEVILLDIGLPERSGIEVAADLARLEERSGMRVIALSGYADDAAHGGDALFDGRLLKPVTAEQLTALLGNRDGSAG